MTKGRAAFPNFVAANAVATISAACALLFSGASCASSAPRKSVASSEESRFELAHESPAANRSAPHEDDQGRWLEAPPPVIFGPDAHRAILYDRGDDAWPVSLPQAQTADGVMQIVLVQQRPDIAFHLGNYFGEFSGRTKEERRVVHMQFFCADYLAFMAASTGVDPADWMRLSLDAQQDGGTCFFHADFDPITGAITDFAVNPD